MYMSKGEQKSWSQISTRPEAKNGCAGEGQQQFNRPTDWCYVEGLREIEYPSSVETTVVARVSAVK
jgi:hypothetical protein